MLTPSPITSDTLFQYLTAQYSWNQVSIQESNSKILPNLDAMHSDIRRLATNLEVKLNGLQQMFSGTDQQDQKNAVKNLREFVQSAATVLSSSSTILSGDQDDVFREDTDDFRSDFGDWFRSDANASTVDWIYTITGETLLFGVSETKASQDPLPTSSDSSEGKPIVSEHKWSLSLTYYSRATSVSV